MRASVFIKKWSATKLLVLPGATAIKSKCILCGILSIFFSSLIKNTLDTHHRVDTGASNTSTIFTLILFCFLEGLIVNVFLEFVGLQVLDYNTYSWAFCLWYMFITPQHQIAYKGKQCPFKISIEFGNFVTCVRQLNAKCFFSVQNRGWPQKKKWATTWENVPSGSFFSIRKNNVSLNVLCF